MLLNCPNCQAVWGFDEFQYQECDCCGYPNNEEDYEDWGDDECDLPEGLKTIVD